MLYQIRYAIDIIAPSYLEWVLDELLMSMKNADIANIIYLANIVASQAIHNGWSPKALVELDRFFKEDTSLEIQWRGFTKELTNDKLFRHDVLINVPFQQQSGEAQEQAIAALKSLGLELKLHSEITNEYSYIADISELIKAEKRYFRVSVEAKDIYSAAHAAIAQLASGLNVASFYNLVNAWDLKSVVIVAINTVSTFHRSFTAESIYTTYDYLDSSGRIFDSTRRIFADESKGELRNKLQGTFGYTNISRASLFQEEKYMNLWVALESLARTDMYQDIISNVRKTVPAAMCIRYIYRIVRNFVEDCRRCKVELKFGDVVIDVDQSTKQKMVREAIAVFVDDSLYAQLNTMCAVNTLLKHRCTEIRKLLTDTDWMIKKLGNHFDRVNWQIQRLYRIRNEIAHSALQNRSSLVVFIEHLNDYLSTYIAEIVTCIAEKNVSTLEEAICYINDNYDVLIALANSDKELMKQKVLSTGIISLI